MKTKRYLNILCAVAAVSAALILSCEQLDGPSADGVPAGEGRVALTISTGGAGGSALRTILPKEDPGFTRYDLIFTSGGATVEITNADVVEGEFNQVLQTGSWQVDVKAYRKSVLSEGGEKEYLAAKGSTFPTGGSPGQGNIEIRAGRITPVTVNLAPVTDDEDTDYYEKGVFSFKVTYPAGTGGLLTITGDGNTEVYPLKVAEAETPAEDNPEGTDVPEETPDTEEPTVTTLIEEVPVGEYTLTIALYTGGVDEDGTPVEANALHAGTQAALYIYSGLESYAEFEFTDEDFISEVLVPLTPPTALPEGFELTEFLIPADPEADPVKITKVEGGIWYAHVPAKYVGGPVSLEQTKAEGTTFTTTYAATVEIDPLEDVVATKTIDISVSFSGKGTGPEVAQAINNVSGSGKIYLDGLTFTTYTAALKNDVTVTGTVTIGSGADITLSNGKSLTVAPNGVFKVDGSFNAGNGTESVEIAQATVTGGNIYTVPSPKPYGWVDPGKTEFNAGSGTLTINGEGGAISLTDGGAIKVTGVKSGDGTPSSGLVVAGNVTLTKVASASLGTFTARITGAAEDALRITAGKNAAAIDFVKSTGDGYGAILASNGVLTVDGPTAVGVGGTLNVGADAGIAAADANSSIAQGTNPKAEIKLAYGASYLNSVGPSARPAIQYDYNWDSNDVNSTVTVTYATGTSKFSDITFTGALSPAPGNISSTLTIPVGATLTVPADRTVTLTGSGSIEVDGTLQVDGGVKVTNTDGIVINRGGKVTVGNTGSLEGSSYNFTFGTDKTLAASYSGFTLGGSSIGGTLVLNATQVLNVTGGTFVTGTLTVLAKVNFTPNISLNFTNGTVIVGNPSTDSVTLKDATITSADKGTSLLNNTTLDGTSATVTLTGNGTGQDTLEIEDGGGIRITGDGKITTTIAQVGTTLGAIATTFTVSGKSKWTVSDNDVTLTAASTGTGATGLSAAASTTGNVLVENGELTVAGKLDVGQYASLTVNTPLTLSGTDAEVTIAGTNAALTVSYARQLTVPANTSLTVGSGGTLNVYGTAAVGAGTALVTLTNATVTGSSTEAELSGTGVVALGTGSINLYHSGSIATAGTGSVKTGPLAANVSYFPTTFTGPWQVLIGKTSVTDYTKSVSIASGNAGATITGNSSGDTPVLKAVDETAAITQVAGSGNNLVIGDSSSNAIEVALGGTTTALGKITLTYASSNTGKLTLYGGAEITTGNASAGVTAALLSDDHTTVVDNANSYTKIGTVNLIGNSTYVVDVEPTNAPATASTSVAGKIVKLIGSYSNGYGGSIIAGPANGVIDSTVATAADGS